MPAHLIQYVGKKEIVFGLRTSETGEAQRRARVLTVATDRLFRLVEDDRSLRRSDIERIVKWWFGELIAIAEAEAAAHVMSDRAELAVRRRNVAAEEQEGRDRLAANDTSSVVGLANHLTMMNGHRPSTERPSEYLCRLLLRGQLELTHLRRGWLDGDYAVEPRDPFFATIVDERNGTVLDPDPRRTSPLSATPSMAVTVMLADLIGAHVSEMSRHWESQTLKQNNATFRMLREHLGERAASEVTRKDISSFLSALAELPSKWGQLPAYRDQILSKMIEIAKATPGETSRLSQKTINRHASAVSGLFTWAKKHGRLSESNPAEGFIDKRSTGAGPKRRPWSRDELYRLFASPMWNGANIQRGAYFFIPLIALFTGMRREEICKLTTADVREAEGIFIIDVLGNAEGRLKEEASNRSVPVHPTLIATGFIKHVERIRAAGGGHLWPELTRGRESRKFGDNFGKWFQPYCKKHGIAGAGLVFHSFRINVGDALRAAGVNESVAADILGHEHKSMAYRVYSRGAAIKPVQEAIMQIDHQIDLSHLNDSSMPP